MGFRLEWLGTPRLTWRDLYVIVRNCKRDSALARAVHGESVHWSNTDHLLASLLDLTAAANWQRGGGKGQRPNRIPRPGASSDSRHLGADPIPLSKFDEFWNEGGVNVD
ncbi:MAG: hypothetical protein ACKOAF_05465 [Actinomycetes bacterium]